MDLWANIPSVILLEVFQFLNRRDRLTCSVVCKTWHHVASNPLLWKDMVVYMDTDLTDPLTAEVTRKYAPHIKSLHLSWSKPYVPRRWLRSRFVRTAQDTCQYLILLRECKISLTSLKITDWYFALKSIKRVIFYLIKFLKEQRQLKSIILANLSLSKSEMLKILSACRESNNCIIRLELVGSFYDWNSIFTTNDIVNVLQPFRNLEVFKVDYSSISERSLLTFIEYGVRSLKLIEIHVRELDQRSHMISTDTWSKTVQTCTNLSVNLSIRNLCHYEDLYYILISTMPLERITLHCGHIWDQTRTRNYCGLFNLLINNFETNLTHVTLHLRHNREVIDYYLYEIIRRCKNLQFIEFDGVLRSMNLVKDICSLKYNHESNFKYFHVRPRNMSFYNNVLLSSIWRNMVERMQEEDFDFEIETLNKSTVRIFC